MSEIRLTRRQARAIRFGHAVPAESKTFSMQRERSARSDDRAGGMARSSERTAYQTLLWREVDWLNLWDVAGLGPRIDFGWDERGYGPLVRCNIATLYSALGGRPVANGRAS